MNGLDVKERGTTLIDEVAAGLERFDGSTSRVIVEIELVQVGGATRSVSIIIAFAVGLGLSVGGICGVGSVPGSQHQHCNAVDLFGPIVSAFSVMLSACRNGTIPCAELIGPGGSNGMIATASGGWVLHPYTGPNSHNNHIHASGSPLM